MVLTSWRQVRLAADTATSMPAFSRHVKSWTALVVVLTLLSDGGPGGALEISHGSV